MKYIVSEEQMDPCLHHGEKLTVLYLLHNNVLSRTNKTDDKSRQATQGGTTGANSASSRAVLKSVMLTAFIDAHKERNVMTCNIPNMFI
jgi:hypothetical protein